MVREEDVERWFVGSDGASEAARFMTVCFDATPAFKEQCPAAVHVDGTARPQLVRASEHPDLHRVLTLFGEKTGTPVLITTSFNMHEEPLGSNADRCPGGAPLGFLHSGSGHTC